MTAPEPTVITVYEWRARTAAAFEPTPACPCCDRTLGIRLGVWRKNGRDAGDRSNG